MSLKSIRTNYSKLLSAFESAGVKMTESQKAELDTFIVALESQMDSMKKATVKATKKVVTEHLDKEYKQVFESILAHKAQHDEIASKIQSKITALNESKKIARKVNGYLDRFVESALPEKTIIDYDRMEKLEALHESLKDLLVVNEDAVEAKKEQLQESFTKQKRDLETKIAKLQVKLNESMKNEIALSKQIDQAKAQTLLESKLSDIPAYEAKQIRKRLAGASSAEVEKRFKKIFESVKSEIKEEEKVDETSLEEEISNIIEKEEKVDEADGAKGTDSAVNIDQKKLQPNRKSNKHIDISEADDEDVDEAEKVEEDDVELDESEKIDSNLMALWCDKVGTIETKGY